MALVKLIQWKNVYVCMSVCIYNIWFLKPKKKEKKTVKNRGITQ